MSLARYTGKERDTESGLDYFGARYYGSSVGRFMSPDWSAQAEPVPCAKLGDPQSLNLYSYMQNNPLGGVDADGHWPDWSSVKAFGSGFADASYRPFTQAISHPLNTGSALLSAAAHPLNTASAAYGAVVATGKAALSGDPHALGEVAGTIATTAATAGGAKLVGGLLKGAEVANGVSDAALAARAAEIHGALDPIAQSMRTTAVASVTDSNGVTSVMVGSSQNTLSRAQRAMLGAGEAAATGPGHAEVTVINAAQAPAMNG